MRKLFTLLCLVPFSAVIFAQEFVPLKVSATDTLFMQHAATEVVDINDDGILDIVISGEGDGGAANGIFISGGDKTFTLSEETNVITPGFLAAMDHGDIDADGDIDFIFNGWVVGDAGVTNGVALNEGSGVFTLGTYEMLESAPGVAMADLNNDALMDYISLGKGLSEGSIYFQNQDGTFTKDQTAFSDLALIDAEVNAIDFNNDGYLDLFLNAGWNEEGGGRVSRVYINDYFGGFSPSAQPNLIRKGYGSGTWFDVDGDGNLDLLLNGDGGTDGEDSNDIYRLYKNNNGTLEEAATFSEYRQISVGGGARFADFDNDGDADIILTGWSNPTTEGRQVTMVFECTDAATFTYARHSWSDSDQVPGVSESDIEVADFNQDHKIDIVVSGFSGNFGRRIAGVIFNDNETANTLPGAPSNLSHDDIEGGGIMFSWDAGSDTETPTGGLTYSLYLKDVTNSKWLINPEADLNSGIRKVTGLGNVDNSLAWPIYELPDGDYEWSVQTVDGVYEGSTFPTPLQFTIAEGVILGIDNSIIRQANIANLSSFDGELHVEFKDEIDQAVIQVFSLDGRELHRSSAESSTYTLPLNEGLYIINIHNQGRTQTTKVVVF